MLVLLLMTVRVVSAAPVSWTAVGDVSSLDSADFQAELEAAAAVWTVDTDECGPVPLFAWTGERDEAEVVIETVSDLGPGVVLGMDCEPGQTCFIRLADDAPWALPADAAAAGCQDQLHLRAIVASSMGAVHGVRSFGQGETVVGEAYDALMYWAWWCREEVALNAVDLALLDLDLSVPVWQGVPNGGTVRLAPGETAELMLDGPPTLGIEWSLDGEPAGVGDSFVLGPIDRRTRVDASVDYVHGLCDEQWTSLSLFAEPAADVASSGSDDSGPTSSCGAVWRPSGSAMSLLFAGLLLLSRRGNRSEISSGEGYR